MTIQGGTSPACAACKFQRKKCSSHCILAPYFPGNQPKVFQNVHRLFGVSNLLKILKKLDTNEQKDDAMKSIRYESDMREKFPVYGCLTIIYQLRQQLQEALEEVQFVHAQLSICRQLFHCQIDGGPSADAVSVSQHSSASTTEFPPLAINNYLGNANNYRDVFTESRDNLDNLVPFDAFSIQQERDFSEEYDDMLINTMADDRQSYVGPKEASESSSESSLRDATQSSEQVSKSELRSAAACFSLTSVN